MLTFFYKYHQKCYSQYPARDDVGSVVNELIPRMLSLNGKQQLYIRRSGDNGSVSYVLYSHVLDDKKGLLGICVVFNDKKFPCNISYLFEFFESQISNYIRDGRLLNFDSTGNVMADESKVYEHSALIHMYTNRIGDGFNYVKANFVKYPQVYYEIAKSQAVVLDYSLCETSIIKESVKHNNIIIVTKEIEEENINSMRSFIKKSNETVDDLNKKIKKLEEQLKKVERDRKKQSKTNIPKKQSNNTKEAGTWVILGIFAAIILLNLIAPWFIPSIWPKLAVFFTGIGTFLFFKTLDDDSNNKTSEILGWGSAMAILLSTILTIYGICGGFSLFAKENGGSTNPNQHKDKLLNEVEEERCRKKNTTPDSIILKSKNKISEKRASLSFVPKILSKSSIPSNYILIPGGHLSYKGINTFDYDYKKHNVDIDSFYISAYELTQGEYERVMGGLKKFNYQWLLEDSWYVGKGPIYNEVKGKNIPVRGCLRDFAEYCNKRSAQEGFDGFYIITNNSVKIKEKGNGYRLVTPYEWIYAAYGGRKNIRQKYLGGKNLNEVAWHLGNSKSKPHPVGLKKPNAIGIFDMQGNAPEVLQGDNKYKYYISTMGGYNISNWNYEQTYDVTYIWGEENESNLLERTYGTRIAFIPKGLNNINLKRKYKY